MISLGLYVTAFRAVFDPGLAIPGGILWPLGSVPIGAELWA